MVGRIHRLANGADIAPYTSSGRWEYDDLARLCTKDPFAVF